MLKSPWPAEAPSKTTRSSSCRREAWVKDEPDSVGALRRAGTSRRSRAGEHARPRSTRLGKSRPHPESIREAAEEAPPILPRTRKLQLDILARREHAVRRACREKLGCRRASSREEIDRPGAGALNWTGTSSAEGASSRLRALLTFRERKFAAARSGFPRRAGAPNRIALPADRADFSWRTWTWSSCRRGADFVASAIYRTLWRQGARRLQGSVRGPLPAIAGLAAEQANGVAPEVPDA